MGATAVTPSGVRDGDPAALAGLCERRGPAVLAYCRVVAGESGVGPAAAEAFAHFRAAVFAAEDPRSINPEALLMSVTRHAAARHVSVAADGLCAEVPALLAARGDRSISLANLEFLEGHLATCWTCRAPVARYEAAERAYVDPGDTVMTPEEFVQIVSAMTAVAPIAADEPAPEPEPVPEPQPVPEPVPEPQPALAPVPEPEPEPAIEVAPLTAAAQNGHGHLDPDPPAPVGPQPLDQPTTEYRALEAAELPPLPQAPPPLAPEPAAFAPEAAAFAPEAAAPAHPEPGSAGALGAASGRGSSRVKARPKARKGPRTGRGSTGAVALPRPQRGTPSADTTPRQAGRSPLRASLVLPIILVACALVIALFVAGVFGADDPASTPSSATPPPPPAATTKPDVVVVPGAADASARAVELAKERARARREREAAADSASSTPAAPPPPPVRANATPPPAAAADAPADSTPASKPKAGIDADNGATGAEQLPPAQDTSTVPELAPPPEPAAPPG